MNRTIDRNTENMGTGKEANLNHGSGLEQGQADSSDGQLVWWSKHLDEDQEKKQAMIFAISYQCLALFVQMILAAHLASSKLIEDSRAGLPEDQSKLAPTSPNNPSPVDRIVQSRGDETDVLETTPEIKTVLTPFLQRDQRTSNRRRWSVPRKSPLRVDLMEETRKLEEEYRTTLEEVRQSRAKLPKWYVDVDDGLDPQPEETMHAYVKRVKKLLHRKW